MREATHRARPADGRSEPHRRSQSDGAAPADVLVGADDDRPRRGTALWAGLAVAAVLLGAAAVDRSPDSDVPELALRAGVLVPRDRVFDDRSAEAGMHVEVVNTGDRTLDLREASLEPGAWEVDIVDRSRLSAGESLVLSLHRTVTCDERASYGPFPEHLVLEARTVDGERAVVRLPVGHPSAYGGQLDDALRDPGRACAVTGEVGGPIGDLVGSWRARRTWPPSPST